MATKEATAIVRDEGISKLVNLLEEVSVFSEVPLRPISKPSFGSKYEHVRALVFKDTVDQLTFYVNELVEKNKQAQDNSTVILEVALKEG